VRFTGLVKSFDVRHGCGLITRQDGLSDVVLRQNGMQGTGLRIIAAGDAVEFEVVDGPLGPLARNVVRLMGHGAGFGPAVARHASA